MLHRIKVKKMVRIYLLRHGQTVFNVEHVISGQIETDLTDVGKQQALDAALELKKQGVSFDVILCSTLGRAKETAKIISGVIKAPIVEKAGLQEFYNGVFEGVKIEQLQQMHFEKPYNTAGVDFENGADLYEAYSSFDEKYDTFAYPKGEQKCEARERFMKTIEDYISANPTVKNMAVVAHGGVIRFMLLKICPNAVKEKIKNLEARVVYYDTKKGFYA